MRPVRPARAVIADIVPYDAKNLPADVFISANENPDNPPQEVLDEIEAGLADFRFNRYPDPLAGTLRAMIAETCGIAPECVLPGNGGDEQLFNIFMAWGGPGRKLLNITPTFSIYAYNAMITGTEVVEIPRSDDFKIDEEAVIERASQGDIDIVVVGSPNNPTGDLADEAFMLRLLDSTDALVLIDEAYGEYSAFSMLPHLKDYENLLILHTFSKAYSLAGLRLGYILANPSVIDEFLKVRQNYSIDAFAQLAGECCWRHRDLFMPRIGRTVQLREELYATLRTVPGVEVWPSDANYLLFRIENAHEVWKTLYDKYSVLVRDFSSAPGLKDCLRVTVGSKDELRRFLLALCEIVGERLGKNVHLNGWEDEQEGEDSDA